MHRTCPRFARALVITGLLCLTLPFASVVFASALYGYVMAGGVAIFGVVELVVHVNSNVSIYGQCFDSIAYRITLATIAASSDWTSTIANALVSLGVFIGVATALSTPFLTVYAFMDDTTTKTTTTKATTTVAASEASLEKLIHQL
jgi:hypothetical protein